MCNITLTRRRGSRPYGARYEHNFASMEFNVLEQNSFPLTLLINK